MEQETYEEAKYSLFKSAIGQFFYILPPNSDLFSIFTQSKILLKETDLDNIEKEFNKLKKDTSKLVTIKH